MSEAIKNLPKGCIYIMTNPCLQGMVKIGYAEDVNKRKEQLSTTALPHPYEIYAVYQTPGKLEDKKLHKLIDTLNPNLRISKNREFFEMSPEEAFTLLETVAIISGTQNNLLRLSEIVEKGKKKRTKARVNFSKCGIPKGATLVFTRDSSITVSVIDDYRVMYNNEVTTLSPLAGKLIGAKNSVQGTLYFTYDGELILNIAKRTQWAEP